MAKKVIIFGGSGFLGRAITYTLVKAGYHVCIASRDPDLNFLKQQELVKHVSYVACDYTPKSIERAAVGAYGVVNCIGLLYEKGQNTFTHAHVNIPKYIAQACKILTVEQFVHISALGVERSPSNYAHTKILGEGEVQKIFPKATILRPSIVFGPEDQFFNQFAQMVNFLPFFPLIGGGQTKFQPVYVADVAKAVLKGIEGLAEGVYALGGPDIVSFKEVYQLVLHYTGKKRPLIPVPWCVAYMQGAVFSLLPKPLLTVDQVRSLRVDNTLNNGEAGFKTLGITPASMAKILPTYLGVK